MPRYEDDDDDDRPRRRSQRRYDEDEDDDDDTPRIKPGQQGNGFATASMILGLVGFCVPLICGLLAMLFGFLGLSRAKVTGTGKGMAITGIILGFVNGIIEPSAIGYGIYYAGKKAKQAADKLEAEIQAEQKRIQDDQIARQKKWDDDRKERERKQAEDQKKFEEDQKIAAAKRKEDDDKRMAESKARQEEFARKQEEDRIKREQDFKDRTAKMDEDRKKREEDNKLTADIAKARQEIFVLENAVRTYTIRNKNKPPATLQALLVSPTGGPGLINANTPLKDPWGKEYQYDPTNKNLVGGLDPLVFTVHPKTGEKILAFNRK